LQVKKRLDNLVNMVEEGDLSEALKARILRREEELKDICMQLDMAKQQPVKEIRISTEKVQDMLLGLNRLIDNHREKVPALRNACGVYFLTS
jgi:hypothetical protein